MTRTDCWHELANVATSVVRAEHLFRSLASGFTFCGGVVHRRAVHVAVLQMSWHKTSSKDRGYGIEWQKKREQVMRRDKGLCMVCLGKGFVTAATEVDHITNKAEGLRRKIPAAHIESLLNLQAICKECHAIKTAKEAGGVRKPVTGRDGWPIC